MDTARALAEIAADPDRVNDLPEEELADVLADLERLKVRVWSRLHRPSDPNSGSPADGPAERDQLLDAEAVAEILDVTERYVYDHADEWPFTRRISPRKLRFSERGLHRWLENRP